MNQGEIVLAAMAPADGAPHTPVQVQKLFFLIDRNIAELVDGPHFDFHPWNYGPFDKAVYAALRELASEGHVDMIPKRSWMSYKLSVSGQELGEQLLDGLPPKAQEFMKKASRFVRQLTFTQLVSAIYKAYPQMRANSVFQS